MRVNIPRFFLIALLLLPAGLARAQMPGMEPPPVVAAHPEERPIEEWEEFAGRFEAIERVEIRSRVNGYLDTVHFRDGQMVQQGDLLFTIDQRPFQAAVREAEAQLRSAQNRLALTTKELSRSSELAKQGYASKQNLDIKTQEKQAAAADAEAAKARLEQAKLDLEYTEIRSPIAGRVSQKMVDAGNLVTGGMMGASLLTTVVSLNPIHFYFDVDEQTYLRYAHNTDPKIKSGEKELQKSVELALADSKTYDIKGVIDFFDTNLDPRTGTLRVRAKFDNDSYTLVPGMFGRARVRSGDAYTGLVIPDQAVGVDQSRNYVLTIGPNNIVASKTITLGSVTNGLRVIKSGLTKDDVVIVKGIQMLRDGIPVTPDIKTIEEIMAPPPAASPQAAAAHGEH